MTQLFVNPVEIKERIVGDRSPIGATLLDMDGEAIDLTAHTIVFLMVRLPSEEVIVNNAAASLFDAAAGKVSYTPSAPQVSTPGIYACYFIDTTGTLDQYFPYNGAVQQIHIKHKSDL